MTSDDRIGIPESLDSENPSTLGMQLITILVEQLDGEFELKRNNGTEFTARFTVIENNNQVSTPAIKNRLLGVNGSAIIRIPPGLKTSFISFKPSSGTG